MTLDEVLGKSAISNWNNCKEEHGCVHEIYVSVTMFDAHWNKIEIALKEKSSRQQFAMKCACSIMCFTHTKTPDSKAAMKRRTAKHILLMSQLRRAF